MCRVCVHLLFKDCWPQTASQREYLSLVDQNKSDLYESVCVFRAFTLLMSCKLKLF